MICRKAALPAINCAKTVEKNNLKNQESACKEVPVSEKWLYCTRSQPNSVKPEDIFKVSDTSPEWFKNCSSPQNEPSGTITLFSRLSGWIYVSAESRNRKHRLGKDGPFQEKKDFNIQNVSSLAPVWMQTEVDSKIPAKTYKNFKPPPVVKQEQKRLILVNDNVPEKSIYSLGDFRHDVRTTEEVSLYNKSVPAQPKNFFEWKEDSKKQTYDKHITEKIGARIRN